MIRCCLFRFALVYQFQVLNPSPPMGQATTAPLSEAELSTYHSGAGCMERKEHFPYVIYSPIPNGCVFKVYQYSKHLLFIQRKTKGINYLFSTVLIHIVPKNVLASQQREKEESHRPGDLKGQPDCSNALVAHRLNNNHPRIKSA